MIIYNSKCFSTFSHFQKFSFSPISKKCHIFSHSQSTPPPPARCFYRFAPSLIIRYYNLLPHLNLRCWPADGRLQLIFNVFYQTLLMYVIVHMYSLYLRKNLLSINNMNFFWIQYFFEIQFHEKKIVTIASVIIQFCFFIQHQTNSKKNIMIHN